MAEEAAAAAEVAAGALVVAEIEMVGIDMEAVVAAIAMEVVAVADMTEIEMGEEEVDMEAGEVEAQTEEAMEEIETDHTDHCDCTLLGGVTTATHSALFLFSCNNVNTTYRCVRSNLCSVSCSSFT